MKTTEKKQTATPVITKSTDQPPKYVVLRGGHRVSDTEYETETDEQCLAEAKYWRNIANTHSHGEKVEVVLYDSKKHRVW